MHKPLSEQVSASEMREMRMQGMTNRQIAKSLEISESTVYRYLGKKSREVQRMSECKKPPFVFDNPEIPKVELPVIEGQPKEEAFDEQPRLRVIREVKIIDLEGALCTYHVDQRTGDVALGNEKEASIVFGMVSRDTIGTFIDELTEIRQLLGA